MDHALVRIVYVSRRADSLGDDEVVDQIAFPAMRFNRSRDITGCLWIGSKHFIQMLEGPKDEVEALYSRIEQDTRHSNVTLLERSPIIEREHERFAMRVIRGEEHNELGRVIARWTGSAMSPNDAQPQPSPDEVGSPFARIAGRMGRLLAGRPAF